MQIDGINLYDPDIHHIPERNYQKFQRCLMMDNGIGADLQAAFTRIDNLHTFINNDRQEDFAQECINLKLTLFSALEGMSYETMAFACMVKDIDGQVYPINTDTDITNLSKELAKKNITHQDVADYVSDLKKKLILN